jgi:hypothetical protein
MVPQFSNQVVLLSDFNKPMDFMNTPRPISIQFFRYAIGINAGAAPPIRMLDRTNSRVIGGLLDRSLSDCFGNTLHKSADTLSMAKGDNPLAGPFYVEGAEPGDTLAVKILDLQVDGDTGVGAFAPGFGD